MTDAEGSALSDVNVFVDALNRGDRQVAIDAARRLLAAGQPLGKNWQPVARFAATVGEWTIAHAAMARYVANDPSSGERRLAQAELLARSGRLKQAVGLIEPFAAKAQGDASYHHFLGTAWSQLGDMERAQAHLRAAVRILPASGASWLALVALSRMRAATPDFDHLMRAGDAVRQQPPASRAAYLYAVGKSWDDLGEVDKAFAAFSEGAELIRGTRSYDARGDRANAASIIRSFDAGLLEAFSARATSSVPRPLFVIGMPRSGTTLVEQILTSHRAVSDGAEVNLIAQAVQPIGGATGEDVRHYVRRSGSPMAAWEPIVKTYNHLLTERFGPNGLVVDKTLNNSRFAGLIRMALPSAPIIWLRRDPLDTAWSCFRTFFAAGLGWSFSLSDLGEHLAAEDRLFEHWRRLVGEKMLVVPYAELVTAPEQVIPRILAHCGLADDERVYNFHRTERAVATSSVAQVRKPLYTSAIGSAAPYRTHLHPFLRAYEAATEKWDCGD
ncbi:tetratricopeptide repeat-containing sulfotransferase family protein [Sphingomonas oleivorans]|uniref:tetratricopeptide repeat-containing sulfotransferase family protein n=1 Tax=Sphingomonas oleivorans TaxID=1735121 RepID=UPI0013FD9D11|nr:sulfotransferase [Sphingomonas oleivorans]